MPWLALPFKDPRCEKVARVFNYPNELGGPDPVPTMVIIGPRGSYVEFYGADMLVEYGISLYPFMREQAAKREIEKLRGVTLDPLLDPGVVLGAKDGSQVFVSDLAGKRVLLLVAEKLCFKSSKFLDMLKTQYCLQNDKNDGFEVIYLSLSHERSSYDECIREVPWLVHPFCEDPMYADSILYRMFGIFSMPTVSVCALLAFEDGKLLGKASDVGGGVEGYSVFPFVDDLEEHTKAELIMANGWYLLYDDTDAYLEELGFRDIN